MMDDDKGATPRDRRRDPLLLALWGAAFVGGSFVLARDFKESRD